MSKRIEAVVFDVGNVLVRWDRRLPFVDHFDDPAEFDRYAEAARAKGFLLASASPLTRSSYHADADFERLRSARGV